METTGKGDVTGIDIIQKCDYFTIGSAKRAYLDVSSSLNRFQLFVATFMLTHILDVKIEHWEESTRRLAVEALGTLGETDVEWTSTVALPKLLAMSLDMDLPSDTARRAWGCSAFYFRKMSSTICEMMRVT